MKRVFFALPFLALCVFGQGRDPGKLSDAELAKGVQLIVHTDHSRDDPMELVKMYDGLRVTDVVDAMQAIGLQDVGSMNNGIRPLWRDQSERLAHRVYGVALTAQFVPSQMAGSQTGTSALST